MSNTDTTGGYGVDYGQSYGAATFGEFEIGNGWGAILTTTRGDFAVLVSDAILDVSIEPEHTALWDAQIELAPVIDDAQYRNGRYRLISADPNTDDVRGVIESIDETDDGTLTIGGRRRVGMALRDADLDVRYRDTLGSDALRDAFERLGIPATVHDAPDQPVVGEHAQRVRAPADFRDVYELYERDSRGQFVATGDYDGDRPDDEYDPTIRGDQPLRLTDEGLSLLPVCDVVEGEDGRFEGAVQYIPPSGRDDKHRASANKVASTNILAFGLSVDVTVPYDWGDHARVAIRYRLPPGKQSSEKLVAVLEEGHGGSTLHSLPLYIENERWASVHELSETDGFEWLFFEPFDADVPAGDYTLTLLQGESQIDYDAVAIYDAHYESELGFDHSFAGPNDVLRRPRKYIGQTVASRVASTGLDVETARLTLTYKHRPTPSTRLATIYAPATGDTADVGGIYRTSSGSLTLPDAATTPRVQTKITIGARNATNPGSIPYEGDGGQTLTGFDLKVDGNAVPIFEDYEKSGSGFEVLQEMAHRTGYLWALSDDGNDGGTPQFRAESFRRGDPAVRRPQPTGLETLGVEESVSTADYANQVTVEGADREYDAGAYRSTARDEGAIAEQGVIPQRVEDPDANSLNDTYNEARVRLADRLSADEQSATITTTPAIVQPGYPYRMGWLEGDAAFDMWGENSWGEGRWGGSVYRTLETSSYQYGETTTLDFRREGGVGGGDVASILALLAD